MTVEWSDLAAGQLLAIRDYLARTSPAYAQALAERIVQKTEQLAAQPHFGAEVPEYADDRVRELFEHPYRVISRVESDRVRVVAVIHAARRLPRSPPAEA